MADIQKIKEVLSSSNLKEILKALSSISSQEADHLVVELCRLAYHYNFKIREAAYLALAKVDSSHLPSLAEVISDGLRDPKIEVFHAAAGLYHSDRQAA
jgi:HEAT repeat protein